jgi:uncharacterized protein (DUF2267 family)
MDYHQFVKDVQVKTGLQEKQQAVKAIQATLQTLSERLFQGEAEQVAAQLPRELQQCMKEPEQRGKLSYEEFMQRIGKREGIAPKQAEQHARAVIEVLCEAVSPGEIDDVISQLPGEFKALFGKQSKPTVH